MTKIKLLDKWKLALRIAADKDLPDAAKLVALRLLNHCNTQTGRCNPSYRTLSEGSGKHRSRVIEVIPMLEARGWLTVERTTGSDGSSRRYSANTYKLHFDRPEHEPEGSGNQDHQGSGNHDPSGVRKSGSPRSGNRDHPPSGNRDHPGPEIATTYIENLGKEPGKKNLGKETTGEAAPPPGAKTPPPVVLDPKKEDAIVATVSEETTSEQNDAFVSFDEFWRHYPRRVKKASARAAWDKALKDGHSPQEIILGAMRFAEERQGEPVRYTPHPANWITDERWLEAPPLRPAGHDLPEMSVRDVIRMVRSGQ